MYYAFLRRRGFTGELTELTELAVSHYAGNVANWEIDMKAKRLPPRHKTNAESRPRGEWLTVEEVQALRVAARQGSKDPDRDELIVAMLFRHALRCSELTALTWEHIHEATIRIPRAKGGVAALHPLSDDVRQLLDNLSARSGGLRTGYLFRAQRMDRPAIDTRTVRGIVAAAGRKAGFGFPVHPHMLRHAKGYQLVNNDVPIATISAYLGHKSIQTTMRYAQVNQARFAGLGDD